MNVRIPLTAFIVLLLGIPAFIDLPAKLKAGPISLMGLLSIVQVAVVAAAVLACRSYPKRLLYLLLPYAMFLAWAAFSVVWASATFNGVQNGIVYLLFGLGMLLTGTIAASRPGAVHGAIDYGIRWMDRIGLALVVVSLAARGLPNEEGEWFIGARAFALLGLIPLSWHIAHWHDGRPWSLLKAWLWFTAIGLSLSRTALAIAILYFAVALVLQIRLSARSLLVKIPLGAVAVGASAAFILNSSAIEQRLFAGDTSLQFGGMGINMSGRLSMWPVVIDSARESPLVGKGLGSSQQVVSVLESVTHPHNDYLRVWHDLGAIGLGLLLVAACGWLLALGGYWRTSAWRKERHAPMEMAAFFAVVGLVLAGLTDNALIYPFFMGPLGVLVGAALGAGGSRRAALEHV